MKIPFNCSQCFQEQGFPSEEFYDLEMQNNGRFIYTCNRGHTTLTVLQEQKFEILFDMGAMALLDGYPREAITSIAASLERFYEFYITIICLKHNIYIDQFQKTWNLVSTQSERQYGAYIFLYLIDHQGEPPLVIDTEKPNIEGKSRKETMEWKQFRNAVIHKGYIPSTKEAMGYIDLVYKHINVLISDLKSRSNEFIQHAVFCHIAGTKQDSENIQRSTMSIPTLISLVRVEEETPDSFEEALESLKRYKQWLYK